MTLSAGNYLCNIYGDDTPVPMEKGRAPRYDNEIAVTEFLAKELGVGVGDKVNVAWQGASGEYLITGFSVCANDLGLNFALPRAGAEKLGVELPRFSLYSLAEPAAAEEAAEAVSKQFGDLVQNVSLHRVPTRKAVAAALAAQTAGHTSADWSADGVNNLSGD